MIRCQRLSAAIGLLALAVILVSGAAAPAAAQAGVFIAAGPTLPVSDYGDYANTGWMADGGVIYTLPAGGVWLAADGFYGQNKHNDDSGDETHLYGGAGSIGYTIGADATKPRPYLFGQAGALVHHYSPGDSSIESSSDTKFMWGGGAGVIFPVGNVGLYLESRYMSAHASQDNTDFIPIFVGVVIGG